MVQDDSIIRRLNSRDESALQEIRIRCGSLQIMQAPAMYFYNPFVFFIML